MTLRAITHCHDQLEEYLGQYYGLRKGFGGGHKTEGAGNSPVHFSYEGVVGQVQGAVSIPVMVMVTETEEGQSKVQFRGRVN